MKQIESLKISFRTMLHIQTKVHGMRASSKLNGVLHSILEPLYAEGHYST